MSKPPFSKSLKDTCFIGVFSCLVLFSLCFRSEGEEKLMETKGPITITSSTLTADNKAHTALFEGSVTAKTETTTIHADKMLVHYTDAGKVTQIEAIGHVKLVKGERVITSDEATFLADEEKVIFTGQPKAVEGTTMVTGTKMIYLMKEDRSLVEQSRVYMEKGTPKTK
jgi:lipopolysaccharide export system protein LptA